MSLETKFDAASFGQAIYDEIAERGLGSIPKRELDILILHLIETHGGLAGLSNGELSIRLRATEARIRGLRYEAALRYGGELRDAYRKRLAALVRNAKLDPKKDQVTFVVEDRFVRSQLLSDLKAIGSYANWSFNSELLKISPEALAEVLVETVPEEDVEKATAALKLTTKAKVREAMKTAVVDRIREAKERTTGEVVALGTDWMKEAAKKLPGLAGKALLLAL